MKKIILSLVLFVSFLSLSYSQTNLFTATYSTVICDTVAINGSTAAGSDWFTNKGYDEIYLEYALAEASTSIFYTCKIAYPTKDILKIKAYSSGDTTISVQAYLGGGATVTLPLFTTGTQTIANYVDPNTVTTGFLIRFKGYYKRNL